MDKLIDLFPEDKKSEISNLLDKAFNNSQSYRTDTEIRVLVLDNEKYTSPGAKYYKSLTEINKLQVDLANIKFEYDLKDQNLKYLKAENNLADTNKKSHSEIIIAEIDIEKERFNLEHLSRLIKGKVKELLLWNTIVKDLEPILIEKNLPLDDPDSYQKAFLLVKNIKQYVEIITKPQQEISKFEIKDRFFRLKANASIIQQRNLVSAVLADLNLSEREFVSSSKILPVEFTKEELDMISKAKRLRQEKMVDGMVEEEKVNVRDDIDKEIESLNKKLNDLMALNR